MTASTTEALTAEMLEGYLDIQIKPGKTKKLKLLPAGREALAAVTVARMETNVFARRRQWGTSGNPEPERPSLPSVKNSRRVQNPDLTPAQARAVWDFEVALSEAEHRNPNIEVNLHWAEENALSRIGALAYIRKPRRKHHHEQAAERFKNLYEARYGSAGGAVDPSNEPVDTSTVAHDSGMAHRIDATVELMKVEGRLKDHKSVYDRLIAHIVLGVPCSEYCRVTPSGQVNKRDEAKAVRWLLMGCELLASILGVRPMPA